MKSEPILTPESVAGLGTCHRWGITELAEAIHPLKGIGLFAALRKTSVKASDRVWLGTQFLSAKHQRLFACYCVDRALKLVDKPDPPSLEAVRVARAFANGDASEEELRRARDATRAAADAAADAAARAAIATAYAADVDDAATTYAADAIATALFTERLWQLNRLRFYLRKEYA